MSALTKMEGGGTSQTTPTCFQSMKQWAKSLKRDVIALNFAYQDPRCPTSAKVVAAATILYAASPIDLIPDFIPVLGQLDDLILVPAGIALSIKLIPKEVMDDARAKVEEGQRLPKSKVAAALVIAAWIGGIYGTARYLGYA